MTGRPALVTLRYRPGADVLTGQVLLPVLGDGTSVTESPDADSTFVWATIHDAAHTTAGVIRHEYLSSFHLVHASARLTEPSAEAFACGPLPIGLAPAARRLVAAALESLSVHASPIAKLRARAESTTTVTLESLQREGPAQRPSIRQVDPSTALALSTSLICLSEAVHRRGPHDERAALDTDQLSRLLRELSSTISYGHGRTAPGTAAATRAAARTGAPLTDGKQRMLQRALVELDDPVSWHRVSASLDQLSLELELETHLKERRAASITSRW